MTDTPPVDVEEDGNRYGAEPYDDVLDPDDNLYPDTDPPPPADPRDPSTRARARRAAATAGPRPTGLDYDRLDRYAARRRATPAVRAAATAAEATGDLEPAYQPVDPDELTDAEATEARRRAALYGDVAGALEPDDPPVRA